MTQSNLGKRIQRSLLRIVLPYVAAAWVAVEATGFFVSSYELPRVILDLALLVATGGGAAAIIIAWFHGEPGSQAVRRIEKILLACVGAATLSLVAVAVTRQPTQAFARAAGHKLVLEIPMPSLEQEELLDMRWAPPKGTVEIPFGWFILDPDWYKFAMPGVLGEIAHRPVMFQRANADEYARLAVIIPVVPEDIQQLLETGPEHESGSLEFGGISIQLNRPFRIVSRVDSVIVRLRGRFLWPGPDSVAGSP